ncbi:MAG: phenylpropionate dioxygenase-like ring-hydroxylating dioxygenase large terminal subunit [Myxococcota bacterium]|jgi:phenylpropionate dioxygenase-like ring-hydroxylating dioxygenase large terminal subunit
MGRAPDLTGSASHVPTTRYTDPDFLDAELQLLQKSWAFAGLSGDLPRPGSYATLRLGEEDILLTRDAAGAAHAFRNICQHRGVVLAEGAGAAESIDCPYHGWVYELDGRLRGVPRPEGFDRLDRRAAGLIRLPLREQAGLLWVSRAAADHALSDWLGDIPERLSPYALEQMRPIQVADWTLPANWKVALEQAIDFYHVPTVHKSLVPHIASEPEMHTLGAHNLQTLPIKTSSKMRQWLDDACSRAGPYTDAQRSQLQKFFIFPNLVLNAMPYHFTVMQFWPEGTDRCRLHYRFCERSGARGFEKLRATASWLASRYILYEDVRLLPRIRRGHAQASTLQQPLHHHERAVAHFHATLGASVGTAQGLRSQR